MEIPINVTKTKTSSDTYNILEKALNVQHRMEMQDKMVVITPHEDTHIHKGTNTTAILDTAFFKNTKWNLELQVSIHHTRTTCQS